MTTRLAEIPIVANELRMPEKRGPKGEFTFR